MSSCWQLEILTESVVQKAGYVIPFAVAGALLNAISCGLFSLLQPETSTGQWVGFSIISGAGRGVSLQMVSDSLSQTHCS